MSAERRKRLERIGRLLKQENLDVVVLNEVDFEAAWSSHVDQAEIIADSAGFEHIVRQRNIDVAVPFASLRFGNAVLSKHPILTAELWRFPARSLLERVLWGNHDSVIVRIELPGTRSSLTIWATHLEVRDAHARVQAASSIVAHARDSSEPVFVVGDLNSGVRGTSKSAQQTALDVLLESGLFQAFPSTRDGTPIATFPSSGPQRTIDWILVPSDWSLSDGRVLASDLSDHLPVTVTATAPPPR